MPESPVPGSPASAGGGAEHAGYHELRRSSAVVDPLREVVRAVGPDATGFLQGQLSQDLTAMAVGATTWSWLLQPAGKVDALLRVSRAGKDEWLLDTDIGWGERVAARLTRFRLRTKVDLELMTDWRVIGVRGPGALAPAGDAPAGTALVADAGWPALPGFDLIGPSPAAAVGPVVDAADWDAARIESGIPVMGAELTERTIPAETGLIDLTVSFTKGCYTGQELVARIDSRGSKVPRHLRGIRLEGPADPGAQLLDPDGAAAGTLTSVALSPVLGWVGLGYVRRAVEVGAVLSAAAGGCRVTVVPLPMVGGPPA